MGSSVNDMAEVDGFLGGRREEEPKEGLGKYGALGGVIACLVVVLLSVVIIIAAIVDGCHEIQEGYVGIYYKFGALQEGVTDPGVHMMQPFVSTYKTVLIRPEEHTLRPVEAITKDGIEISFDGISVLSKTTKEKVVGLIKKFGIDFKKVQAVRNEVDDKIQELGDGGVQILNLVIAKPDIPKDIAQNYKQVKVQWTEQL